MARSLADRIELYLKTLIERSEDKQIEIQRMELAETFSCVPSQVTYVVSTRFKPESGYLAESRRGGSGYMRIRKLNLYSMSQADDRADLWLINLCRQNKLTEREVLLASTFYHQALESLPVAVEQKHRLLQQSVERFLTLQENHGELPSE